MSANNYVHQRNYLYGLPVSDTGIISIKMYRYRYWLPTGTPLFYAVAEEENTEQPWTGTRLPSSLSEDAVCRVADSCSSVVEEDGDSPVLIPKEADDCTCDTLELCKVCQSFQVRT
jgi:hypothetical protein